MSAIARSNIWRDRCATGLRLSQSEADALAAHVTREPTDAMSRLPLLVCCEGALRPTHLAWFIEHMPQLDLGLFWSAGRDPREIDRMRKLWGRALELNPGSASVAASAAWAFVESDVSFGESLLLDGVRAHPDKVEWRVALRDYYDFVLTMGAVGLGTSAAERTASAISNLEELFLLQGDRAVLWDLRQLAVSPALSLRGRLYRSAEACFNGTDPGAQQIAAALVSLARGDVSRAGEFLHEVSGALNDSSVAFPLLRELLSIGERGIVTGFLRRCAKRWSDQPLLKEWADAVDRGETPDFK